MQLQDLREKSRDTEKEMAILVEREREASAEANLLRQELEVAKAKLKVQRLGDKRSVLFQTPRQKTVTVGPVYLDANGQASRCLDLARANQALLESLCLAQSEGLSELEKCELASLSLGGSLLQNSSDSDVDDEP